MPSSSSASKSGAGRECQKPTSLPASFMLHFSLQCDRIWQELSASQPAAGLSCTTAVAAPDAARKVPSGPNQPGLFWQGSAAWDGDRKEHTEPQDRNADASDKEGLLQT